MTAPAVSRLFRSPELARLAGMAAAQGWSVDRMPGGHVAAINPRTGARVVLSGTGYVNRGTLRAKVHEFVQAGLDPDWTPRAARAARAAARKRQEVSPVTWDVEATAPPPAAPITPEATVEVRRRNAPQAAGGRFALVGELEALDVGGYPVKVGHRADGAWLAYTRDAARVGGRRTWYARDRDTLLAKVATDVVGRPPEIKPAPAPAPAEAEWPGLDEHVDPPAPEGRLDRAASAWHVAHVEAGEYPLAEALDALDSATAPALAALEAAGRQDAADLLRAELSRSAVEAELLALYRRVTRGE